MFDEFPDKPKGMHWQTYFSLRDCCEVAIAHAEIGLMKSVERLSRRPTVRRWR